MIYFKKKAIMKAFVYVFIVVFASIQFKANAQTETPLRRPISPEQPMWLIHIDTWNYPDPQKIIDLIPDDIKPYVVMNISLSISHNTETNQFQVAEYGYEIAKSWVRTCAQNQMWAIVQLSSGGYAQFSDFDLSVYEEFYRDYPNFIGFNYAEQFWGYDDPNDPLSAKWTDRMSHFANLLELSNRYGGYLVVSMCWNQWGPSINPIGQMKRSPAFAEACSKYTEHYILCEKYTQQAYQSDMESICLGAYLSGYSGNYGIRYDDTGWTDPTGENNDFTMATAGAVHLEHIMLTGQTVIDGPELIWTQCFRETGRTSTTDGFTMRNWQTFSQFDNVSVDLFRKILDGTVRIPSRQEVIDRTKVVIVNDVNSGSDDDKYSTPTTLFQGLYRMDGDGNLRDNKTFFKKTGRYPTIPVFFDLDDTLANSFQIQVNKSEYSSRWPSVADKVEEFNNLFPSEYSGDIYAGRHENAWVTYNPYKVVKTATGSITFKYNTCDSVELSFSQYTAGIIKEYNDSITIYLSNYDNEVDEGLKTDIIKIYGSTSEPSYSWNERANHQASNVTKNWTNGVFTLTVQHNGPLEFRINCSGNATGRLTSYTPATLVSPERPALYTGPRQYEAECFDYKSVNDIITAGQNRGIRNYSGQGYVRFGTNSLAGLRDTVYALRSGVYTLTTKYSVPNGDINTIDLYVNGMKVGTPIFTKTPSESDWNYNVQTIELNEGKNVVIFKASAAGPYNINIDNIVISQGNAGNVYNFDADSALSVSTDPPAQLIKIQSGSAGVVVYTDSNDITGNSFKSYTVGSTNGTGVADLEMFPHNAINYSVTWKEFYNTSGGEKGVLLRGSGENGSCQYADGMKQGYLFTVTNNNDSSVTLKSYIADTNGLVNKQTYISNFKIEPGNPCWFRAMALDHELSFECSVDSISWEGANETNFTDSTYFSGSTELVWGLNSGNLDWVMDNIAYMSGIMSVSKLSLDRLDYVQGTGPSDPQSFDIIGTSLIDDIQIQVPEGFEISTISDSGYDTILILYEVAGKVPSTTIYVRLKSDLPVEKFEGNINISSKNINLRTISVEGDVKPQPVTLKYNFSKDVASTSATAPPALNATVGEGSTTTAGVVSYTDANGVTSNMFKPYSGGQRNSTGAIDLNLFPRNSTDYSVTWKQCIGSASAGYKVGVLLRGDTNIIGDASTGYVQGIMNGYLFIAYTTGTASEFRIYRSETTLSSLNLLVNNNISSLDPNAGQPIWYRATVSGSSSVSLKIEYSTDSVTWNLGSSATDNTTDRFASGATQIVWGLGLSDVSFYMDDIIFNGMTETSGSLPEKFESSVTSIKGFNYDQGFGPSFSKSFIVWGDSLTGDAEVHASYGFEVSLDSTAGFSSAITLPIEGDSLVETTIYVRMGSGLLTGSHSGTVAVSSPGVLNETVKLYGIIDPGPEITSSSTEIELSYVEGSGPSSSRSFRVSGTLLVDNILVEAPDNFEISFSSGSDYASSLTLIQDNGAVEEKRIYSRLKEGLPFGRYKGDIMLSSTGAFDLTISLTGEVEKYVGITQIPEHNKTVKSTEYYTLTGQKLNDIKNQTGVFIVRKFMSDGTVVTSKMFVQR